MAMIQVQQDIDVLMGLDLGKSGRRAVALDRSGKKLFDKALPNDENRLREILGSLSGMGRSSSSWTRPQLSVRCLLQ